MYRNKFVNDHILDLLKLDYLPDEEKAKLLDTMTEVINQRVFFRVGQSLDENKRNELLKLLDGESEDGAQKFLAVNVPDFLNILEEEIVNLKKELTARVK